MRESVRSCGAYVARTLAEHLGHVNKDEAYLAGLSYDLGKFALAANFPTGDDALLAIECITCPDNGTTFRIFLPKTRQ